MYYTTYGTKWGNPDFGTESGEIFWSSDLTSGLQFGAGDSVAEFDATLQMAFDGWEDISGLDFTYTSSGASDISVVVGPMLPEYSDSVVGYANWSTSGGVITSGTLTFDKDEFWAPYGEGSGTVDFFAVALHEIGHLIGLDHYIPSPGDPAQIMNPSISANNLQSGDIAGAQFIYGTADGGGTPPSDPPSPPPDEPVDDGPDTPDAEPPLADDGGSSGSAAGILVALLGAIVALLFGGGGAVIGLAAGSVARNDDDADEPGDAGDVLLTDLLPVTETFSHAVYVDDFGNFVHDPSHDHGHGCDCGACCGADEDMFLV